MSTAELTAWAERQAPERKMSGIVISRKRLTGGPSVEIAFLSGLLRHRPVGLHKHLKMLDLQREILNLTDVLVELSELWEYFGGLYNLDVLDRRSGPHAPLLPDLSTYPVSNDEACARPAQICSPWDFHPVSPSFAQTPAPHRSSSFTLQGAPATIPTLATKLPVVILTAEERRKKRKLCPTISQELRLPSVTPDSPSTVTRSVLHSPHFVRAFDLPYFAEPHRRFSPGASFSRLEIQAAEVAEVTKEDLDGDRGEEMSWHDLIYHRADAPGIDENWPIYGEIADWTTTAQRDWTIMGELREDGQYIKIDVNRSSEELLDTVIVEVEDGRHALKDVDINTQGWARTTSMGRGKSGTSNGSSSSGHTGDPVWLQL